MDDRVTRQAVSAAGDPLWRALQRLRSTATWLMFGAHPDDEWNGFLAWLVLGQGMRAVYACATRGDGGQNAIGPERGPDLAALRSREMAAAAREIGFGVRWLTPGGDDPIVDFGFSRSGTDTLARWGERLLVERMARTIREIRPDAVSPTFLDVPGQHGHHRAVTQSLAPAMALAADPEWVCGLPPWQVVHAYLPAFSGGGGTYDDEVPPPEATVTIDLGEISPVLGASWAQIGEWSRRFHASQGMGRWIEPGPRPLALHKFAGPPDRSLPLDDRTHDVAGLATDTSVGTGMLVIAGDLERAIADSVAAWPDRNAVATSLHRTLLALDAALALAEPGENVVRHLARKRREAARAAVLLRTPHPRLSVAPGILRPGEICRLDLAGADDAAIAISVPAGWHDLGDGRLRLPPDAAPLGTLRERWYPEGGNDVIAATLSWELGGRRIGVVIDPAEPVVIAPSPEAAHGDIRRVRRLGTAPDITPGRTEAPPGGMRLVSGTAPHVGRFARIETPRHVTLGIDLVIDAGAKIGVVAGETDTTIDWLRQLDVDAIALGDDALDLDRFAVLLVGMFAFRQRPALDPAAVRAWVERGGKLVTLYHRPIDAWDPDATPPRRIVIGRPSYRWRVTGPAAPVTVLAPDSPMLSTPNAIGPGDWEGWVRERGLYFAAEWDESYRPVLELADPGQPPLRGALLEGRVGQGSHVHVALALHHQWEALVPGAFRLLANLVARPAALT